MVKLTIWQNCPFIDYSPVYITEISCVFQERLTNLQEELSKGRNEVARQRETLASLEEELKVCKNNAKTKVSDLEYSFTQMKVGHIGLLLFNNNNKKNNNIYFV